MSDKLFLMEVVTPERLVFSEEVFSVIVPGTEGELGILHGHTPLITTLDIGVVRYREGEGREVRKMALSGGYMEVSNNKAIILADTAEKAEEIDVERAKRAKERAEKRISEKKPDIDAVRAEMALRRALARLKAANED